MGEPAILFVIWALEPGGAERIVIQLAYRLRHHGFRTVIACLTRRGALPVPGGIPVVTLDKKAGFSPAIVGRIRRVIREYDIQLVNTHLWTANLWGRIAARLSGIPVVVTEHSVDSWKKWYHLLLDRLCVPLTVRMIAVAPEVAGFYKEHSGIAADRITVVPNGIETDRFDRTMEITGVRERLNLPLHGPVIGTVGRLIADKGHRFLLDALPVIRSQVPDVTLIIIGDGPCRPSLTGQARKRGVEDAVRFLGTRIDDLPDLYRTMRVLVQPSLREGMPLTVLEALAAGTDVVASDVGHTGRLLSDAATGSIVPPGDCEALARAVVAVLQREDPPVDKQRRTDWVRCHYDAAVMAERTAAVFRDVLEESV